MIWYRAADRGRGRAAWAYRPEPGDGGGQAQDVAVHHARCGEAGQLRYQAWASLKTLRAVSVKLHLRLPTRSGEAGHLRLTRHLRLVLHALS